MPCCVLVSCALTLVHGVITIVCQAGLLTSGSTYSLHLPDNRYQ